MLASHCLFRADCQDATAVVLCWFTHSGVTRVICVYLRSLNTCCRMFATLSMRAQVMVMLDQVELKG
jgi:hypothetical protein